jgi:hypothetical protein
VNDVSVLAAAREIQVPLLAAVLITGCAAKALYLLGTRTAGGRPGPTATFPLGSRRPAATALCVIELALGAGLVLTATLAWASPAALAVRAAVALLFGTGAGALWVLRARRPDAGCGCFGELSTTPVGWRVIVRAVLLCAAALPLIDAPPLHMPASAAEAWLTLGMIVGEIAVIMALSPEISQLMLRLSHADPCEVREVPIARTQSALHASATWRRYRQFLVTTDATDIWREGCWRFLVYPGMLSSRPVEVVFAVHLAGRGAPVRVGVLDTGTNLVEGPLPLSSPVLEKPNNKK